jgi:hypothetical protein
MCPLRDITALISRVTRAFAYENGATTIWTSADSGARYSKLAPKVPPCAGCRTVDLARRTHTHLIDPVLYGEARTKKMVARVARVVLTSPILGH